MLSTESLLLPRRAEFGSRAAQPSEGAGTGIERTYWSIMTHFEEEGTAIGYVLADGDEQAEDLSLESQETAIRQWCEQRGLRVDCFFRDEGESADADDGAKRPAFRQLMERLSELHPNVIVVSSLDRWARRLVVASESFQQMRDLGVDFASVAEGRFELSNPSSDVMLNLLASFARHRSTATAQQARREPRRLATEGSNVARFMILSGARTGSTVLAQALNSGPDIVCFRELFNLKRNEIDYSVDGYDEENAEDLALRERDPVRFLQERIFCRHPDKVGAVGFKFHYVHFWAYPDLWEALTEDTDLRVLHLRRRNLLRMLLSTKIAKSTGVWQVEPDRRSSAAIAKSREVARRLTPAHVLLALRQPRKAAAWFRKLIQPSEGQRPGSRRQATISEDEFRTFIATNEATSDSFDSLFREHPVLPMSYEDLLEDSADTFGRAQRFLDIEPKPLTVTLRRQNPEPLRDLLQNYDELCEAFRDTPYAWMFE
jgi:DNA invertase Pin-like site-specific DNA recombinase